MPLDPYLARQMRLLDGLAWSDIEAGVGVDQLQAYAVDPSEWVMPPVTVVDDSVPSPAAAVPVRIYRPAEPSDRCVLWLHGGGFGGGDLDMPESHVVSAELAYRANATVVAVGYRLASEGTRFPAPVDDAQVAWHWAQSEFGPTGAAFIGGASAGAAIALSTALRLRESSVGPAGMLLAYPFVHFPVAALANEVAREMLDFPRMMRFDDLEIEAMVRRYVGGTVNVPRLALPGHHDLSELPATLVVINEFDDLRPSAELLARQLRESRVQTTTYLARGMPHGHLNRTPSLEEVGRTLTEMSAFLQPKT